MTRIAPVALVIGLLAGCGGPRTPADGGSHAPKAQENRKLAEAYAVAAAAGAATAEVAVHPDWEKKSLSARVAARVEKMLHGEQPVTAPAPPPAPTPQPPAPTPTPTPEPSARVELAPRPAPEPPSGSVLVRERVTSEVPLPTADEAEEATLQAAADRIREAFARLDPPLDYRPSPAAVKADFLRGPRLVRPPTDAEKAALARAGYAADRVYVEYTVEATAEQVREIRGRERVAASLKLFGLLAAAAAVGFVFLRVDAWSQGYLTSWLAFIAAALAGGAVVAYLFA